MVFNSQAKSLLCRRMKRSFPRSKIRGIIKRTKPTYKCGKNIDLLIFLDYVLMLRTLARKAQENALENKEMTITATHIREVQKEVLKSFKG